MKLSKGMLLTVGALIILALAVVFIENSGSRKLDPRIGESLVETKNLTKVNRIEIADEGKSLVLAQNDSGGWAIESEGSFPVDATKVKTLVETLEGAKIQRLAAKDKENFSILGLNEKHFLLLKGEGFESRILLGENRSGGGQYVAFGDDEKAFLLDKAIGASTDSGAWQLQTLVNIAPDQVKTVEFWTEKSSTPLIASREKKEDELSLQTKTSKKVKEYQIKSLNTVLQNLSFKERHDLSNELAKTALSKAKKAKVELFDGRAFEVRLGEIKNKDQSNYYISVSKVADGKEVAKEDEEADTLMSKMMSLSLYEVTPGVYTKFVKKEEDVFEKKVSQNDKTGKKG